MKRSLQGKKVLVTRERNQVNELSSLIKKRSGIPIEVPLLKITCHQQVNIASLDRYEWLIFTSANGIRCFFQHVKELPSSIKIATVGAKTAKLVETYGYDIHFVPSTFNAVTLMDELFEQYEDADNFLLVRGNIARPTIPERLDALGRKYTMLELYKTEPFIENKHLLLDTLKYEPLDFVTFTSPSAVKAFVELTKEANKFKQFLTIPAVCIGTTTEKEAKRQSFQTTIVPQTFTMEKMVETMMTHEQLEGSY